MNKKPLQPQDKYVLRLPDGMRERIKSAAEANNRSMNAEIVGRLETSFSPPKDHQSLLSAFESVETLRKQTADELRALEMEKREFYSYQQSVRNQLEKDRQKFEEYRQGFREREDERREILTRRVIQKQRDRYIRMTKLRDAEHQETLERLRAREKELEQLIASMRKLAIPTEPSD